MAAAAYKAGKTLSFISPKAFVPELLAKVKHDLDPEHLDFIGAQERGIWDTPEGTAFVDGESSASSRLSLPRRDDSIGRSIQV
jgi:hypothetical protein